jgi:hypothetical protein
MENRAFLGILPILGNMPRKALFLTDGVWGNRRFNLLIIADNQYIKHITQNG